MGPGLRDLDLNLLLLFREVMRTGSVSEAARQLGLSQPAASNALARLRLRLGDDLFVRAGPRMQPTALARQLAGPIESALTLLQDSLKYRAGFDPAQDQRHFRVAMTDVGEVYFLPRLLAQLQARAPGVRIHAVAASGAALKTGLQDGSIDLALGPFEDLSAGFYQKLLFRQSCVCLFGAGHAFARRRPSLTGYRQARHLWVANAASPYQDIQTRMEKAGIALAQLDQVSSFLTAPFVVAASDCVVTVPQMLAEHFASHLKLRWIIPPLRLPTLATRCLWHQRAHQDAGHVWLRGVIAEVFGTQD